MPAQAALQTVSRIVISLVDDDSILRRRLQLLLRSASYDVRAYGSAEALLSDPGSRQGECLIAKQEMREIDGATLLRRLRAGGWHGPAVLITTSEPADMAVQAIEEGFHSVLVKPLIDRAVLDAVHRALSQERV